MEVSGHLPASVDMLQRWFRATMASRAGIAALDLADRQTHMLVSRAVTEDDKTAGRLD